MGILWTIWKGIQDTQSERDARSGAESAQERLETAGRAAKPPDLKPPVSNRGVQF